MSNEFDPDWPHGHTYADMSARIICTNAKGQYPIVALVYDLELEKEVARFFTRSGEGSFVGRLINAPAPKRKFVRWVNVYNSNLHETREAADCVATIGGGGRLTCIRVEFEEGDGSSAQ
ncbi:MAG: hypothetical protein WC026_16775 [Hyphomicrobium sp.]|uniref:hypothetical protein n=1 Tax=Hyphomicrobium sp. TaxID=82 RepID=UPI0035621A15